MIRAFLYNSHIIHRGSVNINVVIDHPISDISIDDFMFIPISGNGITNIELPDILVMSYVGSSKQTLFMIPLEIPDNVNGSFLVRMRDRLYTVDNTQYDTTADAVDLPDTEQQLIKCIPQIFNYIGD